MEEMSEDLQTALDLERIDEPKFAIPVDDEATKAIPVITNDGLYKNFDETIVHTNEKEDQGNTLVKEAPVKKEKKKKAKKKGKKIAAIIISTFIALLLIMGLVIFFCQIYLLQKI